MAGRRNKKTCFYICYEVIDSITDANSGCLGRGLGWFRCGLVVVLGGLGLPIYLSLVTGSIKF